MVKLSGYQAALAFLLGLFSILPALAVGQDTTDFERPVYPATRVDEAPELDGYLDDPVWVNIPVINQFIQQIPDEGMPATEKTEVKIVYDRTNLYIAARCYDKEPEKIIANEMRRDLGLHQHQGRQLCRFPRHLS